VNWSAYEVDRLGIRWISGVTARCEQSIAISLIKPGQQLLWQSAGMVLGSVAKLLCLEPVTTQSEFSSRNKDYCDGREACVRNARR